MAWRRGRRVPAWGLMWDVVIGIRHQGDSGHRWYALAAIGGDGSSADVEIKSPRAWAGC